MVIVKDGNSKGCEVQTFAGVCRGVNTKSKVNSSLILRCWGCCDYCVAAVGVFKMLIEVIEWG